MAVVTESVLARKGGTERPSCWIYIRPGRQHLVPFLLGILLVPIFIVLHEGGHFVAAKSLGIRAEMHYGVTTVHYYQLPSPPADWVVTAAGPLVQMFVGGAGLFWLYRLRKVRRIEPATSVDWLATWAALNGGRWFAGWIPGALVASRLKDEVLLLTANGLPIWLGLGLFGLTAFALFVATVRLHPRGARLIPFTYAFVGGLVGLNLWLHWLGPCLLP